MARPRNDEFKEIRIESTQEELEVVDVSVPSFVKVTYKEKISEYPDGRPVYGTSDQEVRSLHLTNDEITKIFQEKGMEVIEIEKATIQFPNICEKCNEKGTPRIENKSNRYDYYPRKSSPYFRKSETLRTEVNRPDEYWLIYDHGKGKKCRIAQYDKNHHLFKPTKNRINELHKHFYPMNLGRGVHGVTLLSKQKNN